MRKRVSLLTAFIAVGLLLTVGARAQTTELVSVASDGTQADCPDLIPPHCSRNSAISADGRFVVFESPATNLVAGDTNGLHDIFVHDRDTGTTERVSVASDGTQGNSFSQLPAISPDGRFVAFDSNANNLVLGDSNARRDVFVHDRDTGVTELVSVASDGAQGNQSSSQPAISADERFVVFGSGASTLVAGDTNGNNDIFVHDRDSGTTELVSVASDGTQGNENSTGRAITAGCRFLAFESRATNLVSGDTNGLPDVFVHDRDSGITERVSVASDGTEGNNDSDTPAIGPAGRFVAFFSEANNLVAGDTNGQQDIFVHDRDTGITERVSVASDGTEANSGSVEPAISANGRLVAFESFATNLVSGDTNAAWDIFVHDRGFAGNLQISIVGTCPGSVSLDLQDATPDGKVGLVWGTAEGPFTVPPGPCAGTEIGLADPTLLMVLTADLSGSVFLDRTVGGGACGLLLQALDVTTCEPSNVASVP